MKATIYDRTFKETGRTIKSIWITLMGELTLIEPHFCVGYIYIGTSKDCTCPRIEIFNQ